MKKNRLWILAFSAICFACGTPDQTSLGQKSYQQRNRDDLNGFNPASCQGAPLTLQEAVKSFQPGASTAILGDYKIVKRTRTCNPLTGCGAWSDPDDKLGYSIGSLKPHRQLKGKILLEIVDGEMNLRLSKSPAAYAWDTEGSRCSAIGKNISCTSYQYNVGNQWGGSGGYYPTWSSVTKADSNPVALGGILTAQCLRLTDGSKTEKKEDEYLIYSEISPGPWPSPESSGCPGNAVKMKCGSAAAAGMTTCCRLGLTTCPQSGCDCWSACN